jgi:hypothetical protein
MKLLSTVFSAVLFLSGLIACKSESDDFEDLNTPSSDSISVSNAPTPAAATPLPTLPPPAITLPQAPAGLPNQVGQRPLVNPAHGLPYHDCSIAVGALLANNGNAAQPSLPALSPTLPNLQRTPAGLKLNPAHGKPGHRCEIAVGAPLS